MTITPRTDTETAPAEPPVDPARGWYLYGITRRGALSAALSDADLEQRTDRGKSAPLELLECSGLAAVVRPVLLADFDQTLLHQRLQSESELETMVRSHNRVIETIHARQAILPAKFGLVYASAVDVISSLRSACDTLLTQLRCVEGCDEWAFHLYADRVIVRDRTSARIPTIARLREEHAAARPGRAYFLERQLRDDLEAAIRRALMTLAQDAFERMMRFAVAGQASPTRSGAGDTGEVEILRAAFLVERDIGENFSAEACSIADVTEGLRCERSGPWPPYSFAACGAAEAT